MKRTFLLRPPALTVASTALIAATYGLVRLAYGLMLPDVQAELGLTSGGAGLVSSGSSLLYCVGAVLGLLFAGRYPRALVVLAGVTGGGGAIGMALSPSVAVFAVATVIASTAAGAASPALVAIIGRNLAPGRVPAAQSAVNAGTGAGLVVAGVLALVLLPDWRTAWFVSGVVTLVVAGAVILLDRGPRVAHAGRAGTVPPASWWAAHRAVIVAALLVGAASAAVWNSGRVVLTDAGVGRQGSTLAWVAIGVGGVAVIVTSRVLARLGPRASWGIASVALGLATVGVLRSAGALPVALVACAVFGWAYTAATGALIAWTTRIDADRAPAGTALLFVVLVFGQAVGAAVAGAGIDTSGYGLVFVGAGVLSIIAAVPAVWRGSLRR